MASLYELLSGLQSNLGEYLPGLKPVPGGEQQAQYELSQHGSIMARPQKSEFMRNNPALDTILSPLINALKAPIENVSGPGQAILGPIRTKAQKQVAKAIFRGDEAIKQNLLKAGKPAEEIGPNVLEQMSKSFKQFNIEAPPIRRPKDPQEFNRAAAQMGDVGESYGVNREVNPALSEMIINPRTRYGRSPYGHIYNNPIAGQEPDLVATALHEALHGFNGPVARQAGREQASTLTSMIAPHLNLTGKSNLPLYYDQPVQQQLGEALSFLGEAARRGGSKEAPSIYNQIKPLMYKATEQEAANYFKQQLIENIRKGK